MELTTKGTLDILNPESYITLTPKFKNYNYADGTVAVDNDNFEFVEVGSFGAVTLRLKDIAEKSKTKQAVVLTYSDSRGDFRSNAINITPKQLKPKLSQSTKQITLQKNDVYSEGIVDISVPKPLAAQISDVRVSGENGELFAVRRIQNGRYAVGFKDQTIGNVGKGKSVKLDIYLVGSSTPAGSVTVKVVVE